MTTKIRGARPLPLRRIDDLIFDAQIQQCEDLEGDVHTLLDLDRFMRDGVVDALEAAHLVEHLIADLECDLATASYLKYGQLEVPKVEELVNAGRAQNRPRKLLKAAG